MNFELLLAAGKSRLFVYAAILPMLSSAGTAPGLLPTDFSHQLRTRLV